jgi:hypothetical protein
MLWADPTAAARAQLWGRTNPISRNGVRVTRAYIRTSIAPITGVPANGMTAEAAQVHG